MGASASSPTGVVMFAFDLLKDKVSSYLIFFLPTDRAFLYLICLGEEVRKRKREGRNNESARADLPFLPPPSLFVFAAPYETQAPTHLPSYRSQDFKRGSNFR